MKRKPPQTIISKNEFKGGSSVTYQEYIFSKKNIKEKTKRKRSKFSGSKRIFRNHFHRKQANTTKKCHIIQIKYVNF